MTNKFDFYLLNTKDQITYVYKSFDELLHGSIVYHIQGNAEIGVLIPTADKKFKNTNNPVFVEIQITNENKLWAKNTNFLLVSDSSDELTPVDIIKKNFSSYERRYLKYVIRECYYGITILKSIKGTEAKRGYLELNLEQSMEERLQEYDKIIDKRLKEFEKTGIILASKSKTQLIDKKTMKVSDLEEDLKKEEENINYLNKKLRETKQSLKNCKNPKKVAQYKKEIISIEKKLKESKKNAKEIEEILEKSPFIADLHLSKTELRKSLKDEGLSDKEIERLMKSENLEDYLNKELETEQTIDDYIEAKYEPLPVEIAKIQGKSKKKTSKRKLQITKQEEIDELKELYEEDDEDNNGEELTTKEKHKIVALLKNTIESLKDGDYHHDPEKSIIEKTAESIIGLDRVMENDFNLSIGEKRQVTSILETTILLLNDGDFNYDPYKSIIEETAEFVLNKERFIEIFG